MKNALTAKRLSDALNNAGMTAKELSDKSGVSKNPVFTAFFTDKY